MKNSSKNSYSGKNNNKPNNADAGSDKSKL